MAEPTLNLDDFDEIKKYEKHPYQETDLLLISYDVTVSFKEVCRSLELEDKAVEKIESQEDGESQKIFCALVEWGDQQDKWTWGELAHQFRDHTELKQIIQTYLASYQPPEGKIFILYYNYNK